MYTDNKCNVKMSDGECCNRPIKRNEKCIFHLENKSKDEILEFIDLFDNFLRSSFGKEDIDFTGFIFPDMKNTGYNFNRYMNFENVIFEGDLDLIGITFNGDLNFSNVKFYGRVNIIGCIFNCKVDFSNTEFKNYVNFSFSEFIGVLFKNTKFMEDARFSSTIFKAANFDFTIFNNNADFISTKFEKGFFFRTIFKNNVYFSFSEFLDEMVFLQTIFPDDNNKEEHKMVSFRFVNIVNPTKVVFKTVNLSNASFIYTDISNVEFSDIIWAKINNRYKIIDEKYIGIDPNIKFDLVARSYRELRLNYENTYRFAEAGDFFIGEMEIKRLYSKNQIERILLNVYKISSLYGESYIRPIIWSFIIIMLYPIMIYLLSPLISYIQDIYPIRDSIKSFFQIGDTYIGERLIGIIMLGLFFIALKRKFERKR